mmetsp:Transcript_129636/g.192949  ORF Transcript_129636/g.192949 Transcript_129636/m.192949 type:complete len:84 (-) Transcript_129636:394-645(-)
MFQLHPLLSINNKLLVYIQYSYLIFMSMFYMDQYMMYKQYNLCEVYMFQKDNHLFYKFWCDFCIRPMKLLRDIEYKSKFYLDI